MQTTWDLKRFYKSIDDPKISADLKKLQAETEKFVKKWKDRTDYLENPTILKEALDDYELWARNYGGGGNPYYYFRLATVLDQLDPKLRAKFNQVSELVLKIQNEIQFFELNLTKVKTTNIKGYEHFLKKIKKLAPHILSDKEEKIMTLKSLTSYNFWTEMTEKFLSRETVKGKTYPELLSLITSTNKIVRDEAGESLNAIFEKYSDVAEAELNAILTDKKIDDELRSYPRPDSARLYRDDVDEKFVDLMVETVSKNFLLAKKYYALKAKYLGLKKLKYHERNVPVGNYDKKYTFEQTVTLINDVFGKLDKEFQEIFQRFLTNGQIDVLPLKGKTGGAACFHNTISQPTYIFLNHTNRLRDVATVAHEMGHGINNELMRRQNALNFDTPTGTAEVASTFFEDFVFEKLLESASGKEKQSLLMSKLDDEVSTIFRQVAVYNFETQLHKTFREKGYLDKTEIGKIFQKHMASYMGPAVEQSPGSQNWWVYWSHIRYFFYVYSYSSGLLISKYLQRTYRANPAKMADIKKFLATGTSASPRDIFKEIGINIYDKKVWEESIKEFEDLLNEVTSLN
ncbi:hypothetical protein A2872_01925 [Candidatus Gottesmanbacteria bacterium RIFCSPHIGHO2_01_FULL_42_12]|uniref:Oligoendopeptidase F n=1 Tax=Candidatus Gottesmanbacteria bacterium RIFCSPHIGHO2_01_FULL_42_12 TaxID=1798377 RepID=A0A1F5Z6A6_9BACT|nr:MAG: hypothetical protein A2872_01925 [Candidatus Gottesmanbacteria bacterium RIFCSPHIGHO2_01_FULL_42_12]